MFKRYLNLAVRAMLVAILIAPNAGAIAQQMDAKLNMAVRSLDSIDMKLANIKVGDIAQYNRLSEQLSKAATLLQETESREHPDYITSIQKWQGLREAMVNTASQWQQAQTAQQDQQAQGAAAESTPQNAAQQTISNGIDANAILAKYQKQNRPSLPNYPNPSEVEEWAMQMRALQSSELEQDLALLKQAGVPLADANRVSRWISGEFQQQIQQDLVNKMQSFDSLATMASQLSEQILGIAADDEMRAYNFAHGENGRNNTQTIENGLVATANAMSLEGVFPKLANANRQQQLGLIAMAQQRLETMVVNSTETAKKLAKLPKKQKQKKTPFLKGISQELWYRGGVLASLDAKGSIWMNNTDVGDIESNGTIWIGNYDLGSIEPDGKIWLRGNHIGTLEENGNVWRNSRQVGSVEMNGKVWIDGNANGEIVPFEGEWKRAAVVYFFNDLFQEQ